MLCETSLHHSVVSDVVSNEAQRVCVMKENRQERGLFT